MADIHVMNAESDLAVRAPRQARTRAQWATILDAGLRLLEEGGYDAFTIAALCEAAGVPPRALYARAATKDALFLAVYEHGMTRLQISHQPFRDAAQWDFDDDPRRVDQAVRCLVQTFTDNDAFLRAIVLISGAHPEIARRGEMYRRAVGDLFVAVLAPLRNGGPDRAKAHDFCFSIVFSAMVVRTAYGPGFSQDGGQESMTRELVTMAQRYLEIDSAP